MLNIIYKGSSGNVFLMTLFFSHPQRHHRNHKNLKCHLLLSGKSRNATKSGSTLLPEDEPCGQHNGKEPETLCPSCKMPAARGRLRSLKKQSRRGYMRPRQVKC